MQEQRKITSVLELARYRVGDVAWWVILRPCRSSPTIPDEDQWMAKHHPKALYIQGPYKELWPSRKVLPKLQHMDFASILSLLTSEFKTEQFPICEIIRSQDTGEFFYSNDSDEWMPESMLLDTKVAAERERQRIMKMIRDWLKVNE